jgi:hypothetical protein
MCRLAFTVPVTLAVSLAAVVYSFSFISTAGYYA